jgi:hypothetical protein
VRRNYLKSPTTVGNKTLEVGALTQKKADIYKYNLV